MDWERVRKTGRGRVGDKNWAARFLRCYCLYRYGNYVGHGKNDEGPAAEERENSVIPSPDRLISFFSPSPPLYPPHEYPLSGLSVCLFSTDVRSPHHPPRGVPSYRSPQEEITTYTVSAGVMNGARDSKRPNNESFPDRPSRVLRTCNLEKYK